MSDDSKEQTHVDLLFPSKYLRAADLKGKDVALVVASVSREDIQMIGGKKEPRVIVRFERTEKMFVANRTNAKTIKAAFGPYTVNWIGKTIVLYPTTTKFGRDDVECIRVRP